MFTALVEINWVQLSAWFTTGLTFYFHQITWHFFQKNEPKCNWIRITPACLFKINFPGQSIEPIHLQISVFLIMYISPHFFYPVVTNSRLQRLILLRSYMVLFVSFGRFLKKSIPCYISQILNNQILNDTANTNCDHGNYTVHWEVVRKINSINLT